MRRENIDELLNSALEVVKARHIFQQYSSPYDAVIIYDIVMYHSYVTIAESIAAFSIGKAIDITGIGYILKQTAFAVNFYSMQKSINPIVGIKVTDISADQFIVSLSDILSETITGAVNKLKSLQVPYIDKSDCKLINSDLKKSIIEHLPFFSAGGTFVAYGWLYLTILKRYLELSITVIPADEMIDELHNFCKQNKSHFQKLAKDATYYIVQLCLDKRKQTLGNSVEAIENNIAEEFKAQFDSYLESLECDEICHVMSLFSSNGSFSLTTMNQQAARLVMTFANNGIKELDIGNIYDNISMISLCSDGLCDMIRKLRTPMINIKDIPQYYGKCITHEIELPEELIFDSSTAEYYMLKSHIQCIDSLVQAMQIILLKRGTYQEYSIREATIIWTFMMYDILYAVCDDETRDKRVIEYTPALLSFIISYFNTESDMPYSLAQVYKISGYCKTQYSAERLDDILEYFPDYFKIISKKGYNYDDSHKLINFITTEYLGNALILAAQNNVPVELLVKKLSIFKIEQEVSRKLNKINRLLN